MIEGLVAAYCAFVLIGTVLAYWRFFKNAKAKQIPKSDTCRADRDSEISI